MNLQGLLEFALQDSACFCSFLAPLKAKYLTIHLKCGKHDADIHEMKWCLTISPRTHGSQIILHSLKIGEEHLTLRRVVVILISVSIWSVWSKWTRSNLFFKIFFDFDEISLRISIHGMHKSNWQISSQLKHTRGKWLLFTVKAEWGLIWSVVLHVKAV